MKKKLSGWVRLWIAFSSLYLLAIIFYCLLIWPGSTPIEEKFFNQVWIVYEKYKEYRPRAGPYTSYYIELVREGEIKNPKVVKAVLAEEWAILAEKVMANTPREVDYSQVRATYNKDLEKLKKKIVLYIRNGLIIWFLPVAAIYLLGRLLGWVINGFRKDGT